MKAAVYRGIKDVKLEKVNSPEIKAGEILIKMRACGVCTTDIKTISKGHPLIKPPTVLGHEVAGDVVKTGLNVTKFKKGGRVVVAPYVPCGACYFCHRGHYTLCENLFQGGLSPGGFAELIKVPASIVEKGTISVSPNVTYEEAALTEPLACCLHGIEKCSVRINDSVVILGDGPIGLLHLQLAKLMGASKVTVSGHHESRLKIASELGADAIIDGKIEDPVSRVVELTGKRGADVVIVAAGSLSAAEQGVKMVRKGGVVNLFAGLPSGSELKLDPNAVHYSELIITGTFGFSHVNFKDAFQLIEAGKIDVSRLVTHRFGLDEVLAAIDLSASRECLKAVIVA